MIRRLLTKLAARHMAKAKHWNERERFRAKARELLRDMGKPIPQVLR